MTTNIAIFASGNGSNFQAIVQAKQKDEIKANIKILICDNKEAYVLQRAQKLGIKAFTVLREDFTNSEQYECAILKILKEENINLICLAGYMKIVHKTLLEAFPNKIMNIHPALLPSFKGATAIEDAFKYGVKVFGVTVHIIDDAIDEGKIIAQRAFEYYGNNIDEVEEKIHQIEHKLYVEAINMVINNNY